MTTPSSICHIEIPSTDLAASKAFYEEVFGWQVELVWDGAYAMWCVPKEGEGYSASGGFDPNSEPMRDPKGVVMYLDCPEVTAHLAKIEAAGGEIVKEKTKISDEHGFMGLFRDPVGNVLGVWSRT